MAVFAQIVGALVLAGVFLYGLFRLMARRQSTGNTESNTATKKDETDATH